MKQSPTEIFEGKKIFSIGGARKITLSMLLINFRISGR